MLAEVSSPRPSQPEARNVLPTRPIYHGTYPSDQQRGNWLARAVSTRARARRSRFLALVFEGRTRASQRRRAAVALTTPARRVSLMSIARIARWSTGSPGTASTARTCKDASARGPTLVLGNGRCRFGRAGLLTYMVCWHCSRAPTRGRAVRQSLYGPGSARRFPRRLRPQGTLSTIRAISRASPLPSATRPRIPIAR